MSINAKELAKLLNLSEAAISMALNDKTGVSTQTRKLVKEAAKKYEYDFTRIKEASAPITTKGTINFVIYRKHGAVVTDTPFFSQLSEGIDFACKQSHYFLNVYYLYGNDNINKYLSEMIAVGCKGIILLGTEMQKSDFIPFESRNIPLIILDTYNDSIMNNCVLINNTQGSYLATSYLISRCKSQPGYLKSSYNIQNFLERADGFYKAIRENGMSTSKSIVHSLTPSMDGAYTDMLTILSSGDDHAKCYFADNDIIAAGAMKAMKEMGYRIPEDISIIGFDNMPICTFTDPALTTVHVPKQYMGEIAVKRLVSIIESGVSHPIKIEINTSLIKRKSVI